MGFKEVFFSHDMILEECRSMHWWAHDGCGVGWIAQLVRAVSCAAGLMLLKDEGEIQKRSGVLLECFPKYEARYHV